MSNQQQKLIRPLTGYFLGWGDDRTPHRYIRLGTANGDLLVKVAKSLRSDIQDWRSGILVNLLVRERIDRATGSPKFKVKQLLTIARIDDPTVDRLSPLITDSMPTASNPVVPTKIQVCQGSSCRRKGSDKICQMMQAYLERNDLTDTVQIESVKCLHQCKAAPQAIVSSPAAAIVPEKTHYRQIQPNQVKVILAKHFPIASQPESWAEPVIRTIGSNFIDKIDDYFQQQQIASANILPQF
jgi:NADH:ubiquinone oxidoreductase subunit E